jgi:CheY-like chemotaxis protein
MQKTVVIVDDDAAVQDVFRIIFQRAGYTVEIFGDGKPLFENKFTIPDIFVLDKQLSGVDGLDICRHLKTEISTSHIPVIMLSATPHLENVALAAGADAFVEKPFINKDLIALADSLVKTETVNHPS